MADPDDELIQKLESSKPQQRPGETFENFDERLGFWWGRQGKMLAMLTASRGRRRARQIVDSFGYVDGQEVRIASENFWFKVVDFLQQSWAIVDVKGSECTVWFVNDGSGVFDRLEFASASTALRALHFNGFRRFRELDGQVPSARAAPRPPYRATSHPSGKIYSSGRFWITP